MTAVTIPRANWLSRRIAELDADIAHLGQAVSRANGRATFDSECALEDAIRERAQYRAKLNGAADEVTP